jgi:cytochrome c oxidase subunit 3
MAQEAVATMKKSVWDGGGSPFNIRWGKMYMWIFLISDAFTYGALRHRFTDIWPRPTEVFHHFPFLHGNIPLAYVGLMTFILIMSSVTMVLAVDAGHRRIKKSVQLWLGLTIIGGLMFLGSQAWEWYHFIEGSALQGPHEGAYFAPDGTMARTVEGEEGVLKFHDGTTLSGAAAEEFMRKGELVQGANLTRNEYGATPLFANFFFFITGFHGFHVFSGVVINLVVFILVTQGALERKKDYELVEKVGLYWHFVDLVWVFVFTFFYLV